MPTALTSHRAKPGPAHRVAPDCAPATKNIVKAVSVMTIVVPRSGLEDQEDHRQGDEEEGEHPFRNPPISRPLLAIQCAR